MKKIRKHCPNPLFEKWITEWYEKAKAENNELQYGFAKALRSLRKCPLTFSSGLECAVMEHFGKKICTMLEKRLQEHNKLLRLNEKIESEDARDTHKIRKNCISNIEKDHQSKSNKKTLSDHASTESIEVDTNAARTNNVPLYFTNTPQIDDDLLKVLNVLYKIKIKNPPGYVTMKQLKTDVRNHSVSSPNKFEYNHCSMINELINEALIEKVSNPVRYGITILGENIVNGGSNSKSSDKNVNLDDSFIRFAEENQEPKSYVRQSKSFETYSKLLNDAVINIDYKKNNGIKEKEKPQTVEVIDVDDYNSEADKASTKIHIASNVEQVSKQRKKATEKIRSIDTDEHSETNDCFVLEPDLFDIILLIDVHETNTKSKSEDDQTISRLKSLDTAFSVRHLNVGDFAWIARCKQSGKELTLPYLVERKRVDDLSSSIKDGRFHEQKFRLKRSGVKNIIYLIEGLQRTSTAGISVNILYQASINSLVQDGFSLKFTKNHKCTMTYLSLLTKCITDQFKNKRLISCKKIELESKMNTEDTIYLMDFTEFNKSSTKMKTLKVQEMFVRQLAQMKGVSIDKAMSIAQQYPTPLILKQEFMKSGENLLSDIKVDNDKKVIGATISQSFHKLYTNISLN